MKEVSQQTFTNFDQQKNEVLRKPEIIIRKACHDERDPSQQQGVK